MRRWLAPPAAALEAMGGAYAAPLQGTGCDLPYGSGHDRSLCSSTVRRPAARRHTILSRAYERACRPQGSLGATRGAETRQMMSSQTRPCGLEIEAVRTGRVSRLPAAWGFLNRTGVRTAAMYLDGSGSGANVHFRITGSRLVSKPCKCNAKQHGCGFSRRGDGRGSPQMQRGAIAERHLNSPEIGNLNTECRARCNAKPMPMGSKHI